MVESTMSVSKEAKERWATYKNHPKESMESLIDRVFKLAYDDEEGLSDQDLENIAASLNDFKNNKFKTNKELLAEL